MEWTYISLLLKEGGCNDIMKCTYFICAQEHLLYESVAVKRAHNKSQPKSCNTLYQLSPAFLLFDVFVRKHKVQHGSHGWDFLASK